MTYPDSSTVLPQGADLTAGASANPMSTYGSTVPNAMPATAVTSTPITSPQVPSSVTDPLSTLVAQAGANVTNAQTTDTTAQQKFDTSQNDGNALAKLLLGESSDTIASQQAQGIPQLNNDIRSAQLNVQGLQQKYLQGLTNIESGNIRSLSQNQAVALQRSNAIDVAVASAQLQAKQGNLLYANELVKNAIDAKYQPIKDALKLQNEIITQNKDSLTRADTKLAAEKLAQNNLKLKEVDKQIENDKTIQDMMIKANAQNAPTDVLARANEAIKKGASPMQVANILGPNAGDYLQNELLKQQIKTQISTQAKNYADTRSTNISAGLTPDGKVDPNATVVFKPLTEGQGKDLSYAQTSYLALPVVDKLTPTITSMTGTAFKTQMALASSPLTSGNVSPEIRQYYQATKNMINSFLRRDSGATINPSEFADAFSTYVPFPGDDPQTLLQKKEVRETKAASIKSNVPQYDQRVKSQTTPEERYKDTVTTALGVVEQKVTPVSSYVGSFAKKVSDGINNIGKQ